MDWKEIIAQGLPGGDGLFGVDVPYEQAQVVVMPVPWEVTTSYGGGTAQGPAHVKAASSQLDLFDIQFGRSYECGIHMLSEDAEIMQKNNEMRSLAQSIIAKQEQGANLSTLEAPLDTVNQACHWLNQRVYQQSLDQLKRGKQLLLLGGDHAVPQGYIQALAEYHQKPFGILHIDAHHDLRCAYEGFRYSHASIIYNVLEDIAAVRRVVSVGIRDFCESEFIYAREHSERVTTFYDRHWQGQKIRGIRVNELIDQVIDALPEEIYISFDIDGLNPFYCPSTGTPVPGGLDYAEVMFMLERLVSSGKRILGADLCEVSHSETHGDWDGNVGARILYAMIAAMVSSRRT